MKNKLKKFSSSIIIVVLAASTLFFGYKYYVLSKDPQAIAKTEVADLVSEISKIVVIPTEEVPTVATITDVDALKSQPFFVNAINGDKVLVFAGAQKAILYRPSIKKIIETTTINTGNVANTEQATKAVATTTEKTDN